MATVAPLAWEADVFRKTDDEICCLKEKMLSEGGGRRDPSPGGGGSCQVHPTGVG